MKFFRLLVLALPLLLTACGLSEQQKADYAAVQRSGVNSATYDKMTHGDDLSLYDVKALARAGVSEGVILRYMRNQGTIYVLNAGDVDGLLKAGVSKSVVDYMMSTPHIYGPAVYPVVSIGYGPYWGGPYWGPGPYYPAPYCYPYRRGCWH
jgi:hypothetical protein